MAHIQYYWEDLQPGQVRDLGTITPTKEEILAFASQFDPQAFHLDEEAAKASVFGSLCASGWHTCAMAMRLMVTNFLHEAASLGSPGLENVKWMKPVLPGDTLHPHHRNAAHAQQTRRGFGAHELGNVQPTRRQSPAHGRLGHVSPQASCKRLKPANFKA